MIVVDAQPIGDIDTRAQDLSGMPAACPECGAHLMVRESRGRVWIGPADLKWSRKYGVVKTGGPYEILGLTAECSVDEGHFVYPVIMA